jgi:hypothetical protein
MKAGLSQGTGISRSRTCEVGLWSDSPSYRGSVIVRADNSTNHERDDSSTLRPRRPRPHRHQESPVSAIAGSVLGLAAFMLAFTFAIVAER